MAGSDATRAQEEPDAAEKTEIALDIQGQDDEDEEQRLLGGKLGKNFQLPELPSAVDRARGLVINPDKDLPPEVVLSGPLARPQETDKLERDLAEAAGFCSFAKVASREALDLGASSLSALPSSFGRLQKLRKLRLEKNSLQELPSSFGSLRALQELDLSSNRLERLPESFSGLGKLQRLNLVKNELKELPGAFGRLTELRWLELQENCLECLPEDFGQLRALEMLRLEDNRLASLPKCFGSLPKLRCFRAARNHLKELPESFGDLQALQVLHLEANRLRRLPSSFSSGKLQALEDLDLSGNSMLWDELDDFDRFPKLSGLRLGPVNNIRFRLWQLASLAGCQRRAIVSPARL